MGTILGSFINNRDDLIALKDNVIKGQKFRFSILSERLIRIEYNKDGIFEDRASGNVIYRRFPKVLYNISSTDTLIQITTSYFTLN